MTSLIQKPLLNLYQKIRTCEQYYLDLYYAKEHVTTKGKDKRFRKLTYNINPKAEGGCGNFWSEERKEKIKIKI